MHASCSALVQHMHMQSIREAAAEVDRACGGLQHIELAENDVSVVSEPNDGGEISAAL